MTPLSRPQKQDSRRILKVGNERQPRCHACGRPIKMGHEITLDDGNTYGSGCAQRAQERMNSDNPGPEQERFI